MGACGYGKRTNESSKVYLFKEIMICMYKMLLRSGRIINFFIDFDEASKAWRKNKIYLGEGQFQYK